MTWAYKQSVRPVGAKFVLVALANYANGDGYCYASQERIAGDVSQGVRTVRRHLAALEAAGWIVRERRMSKGGGRAADGFYLVGYTDELPAKMASKQPAKLAANREGVTGQNGQGVTGQFRQGYRPVSTPTIKELEPTIEPTIRETRSSSHVRAVPKPSRASDPIWDALVAEIGHGPETKSERGAWNTAVSQLREVEATAEQVRDRCRRYRAEWPKVRLTPTAIVRHWSEFATSQVPEYQPPAWTGWRD